ncbi:hypothetical protein CF326_g5913 [Tilletia indica]|nr:hypothetical protein CF326_g5913 [Tilletia indica]
MILQHFIEARRRSDKTLKTLLISTLPLSRLSWKLKLATDVILGLHFHAFSQPRHLGTHENRAPWHVDTLSAIALHREYWNYYQGEERQRAPAIRDVFNSLIPSRLPTLRCVSLDLRPQEPMTASSLREWKTKHLPPWIYTSVILERIALGSRGIEELSVRLTPQQDLIDFVVRIVANNPKLRVLRIEVDSAVVSGRNIRPYIKLHSMFPRHAPPLSLERFVLRAPSCDVVTYDGTYPDLPAFYQHLRATKEFVLVCSVFQAIKPTVPWIHFLLSHMPNVVHFDFAVHAPDSRHRPMGNTTLPMVHLHALERMSIQMPEVDTHLLRRLNALSLYKLRIKSSVPISDWPVCEDNHFPNLFIANMMCPGPSATRIRAVGVPDRWFYQNLGDTHNWTDAHSLPFLAYIKPYSRRRYEPPAPETSPATHDTAEDSGTEDAVLIPYPSTSASGNATPSAFTSTPVNDVAAASTAIVTGIIPFLHTANTPNGETSSITPTAIVDAGSTSVVASASADENENSTSIGGSASVNNRSSKRARILYRQ